MADGSPGAPDAARRVTVFLLDDHEVVRRGVRDLIEGAPDLEVVGEAGTAAEALHRVPAVRPDVAVLDVRLPDGSGIDVCRELRSAMPELRCLILTSFTDDEALVDALMAGASGYVLKEVRGLELIASIRRVVAGESLLDQAAVARVVGRLRNPASTPRGDRLTNQEAAILDLLAEGLTNRQIAERMFLAEKTVKNYVSNLLAKLGMHRRTEAAVYGARLRDQERRPAPG